MAYFNPGRRAYIENPYPTLAQLRDRDPVYHSTEAGGWLVTTYEDCAAVLRDHERFPSDFERVREQMLGLPSSSREVQHLAVSDPPEHDVLRSTINVAFSARGVEELRPRIADTVRILLDRVPRREPFDAMELLAIPFPEMVIAHHLRIPPAEWDSFIRWAKRIRQAMSESASPQTVELGRAAQDSIYDYLDRAIAQRMTDDVEGVLALMARAFGVAELSREQLVRLTVDLATAGNEPMSNMLGNALIALLRHPDQLQLLRERRDLAGAALDELARFESPVQALPRVASRSAVLGNRTIATGELVWVMLGAANRDPARFEEPDRLDITRADRHHFAFGLGSHFCIGAPLARLALATMLEGIVERLPTLRLVDTAIEWERDFRVRKPLHIRVVAD